MNLFLIFQYCLIGAFVVLFVAFTAVMVLESAEECISQLLGLYAKNEILKFLGIGMGGLLLALQAMMSYKRAKALEDTANAQAEAAKAQAKATEEQAKANEKTEQGQRQERLKNAIEHLGHDNASVRLGGAYELFHLAEDTAEDMKDLRQTVLDILCAHIRQTTGEDEYQKKYPSKPSEEIQSLLTLLFAQEHEVFTGLRINLQGSWLNGVRLIGAHLVGAIMMDVRLHGANLVRARLYEATLAGAQLDGAMLDGAMLHGTNLFKTQMHGASLRAAQLYGVDLCEAQMHGADLSGAQLQGACLKRTQLQGANLSSAQLAGVSSSVEYGDYIIKGFLNRMMEASNKESDLSQIIFVGGLNQGDVDSIVKDLSDEEAEEVRKKLEPHIGKQQSYEPPENSGVITGDYTEEDAAKWVTKYLYMMRSSGHLSEEAEERLTEHEKTMSEVPEESDN